MEFSKNTISKRAISFLCSILLMLSLSLGSIATTVTADNKNLSKPLAFTSGENYGGTAAEAFNAIALTKNTAGEYDGGFVAVGYSLGTSEDPVWGQIHFI